MSEPTGTVLPDPSKTAPTTTEPAKTEPTTEPVKAEPTKTEPVKVEPLTLETLKFPEQVIPGDDPVKDEFLSIVNDDKLDSKGRAQALLDLYGKALTKASETGSQAWNDLQAKWEVDAKADPVIGGANLDPALANISKLIDQYSTGPDGKADPAFASQFRDALDLTGAGNNPAVIRFLSTVAKALVKEGTPVQPGSPGNSERTAAQILYPDMKP